MPNIIYILEDPQEIRIGRSKVTYEYGTVQQVNNWYRRRLKERYPNAFLSVPRGRDPAAFLKEWEAEHKPKRGRKAKGPPGGEGDD